VLRRRVWRVPHAEGSHRAEDRLRGLGRAAGGHAGLAEVARAGGRRDQPGGQPRRAVARGRAAGTVGGGGRRRLLQPRGGGRARVPVHHGRRPRDPHLLRRAQRPDRLEQVGRRRADALVPRHPRHPRDRGQRRRHARRGGRADLPRRRDRRRPLGRQHPRQDQHHRPGLGHRLGPADRRRPHLRAGRPGRQRRAGRRPRHRRVRLAVGGHRHRRVRPPDPGRRRGAAAAHRLRRQGDLRHEPRRRQDDLERAVDDAVRRPREHAGLPRRQPVRHQPLRHRVADAESDRQRREPAVGAQGRAEPLPAGHPGRRRAVPEQRRQADVPEVADRRDALDGHRRRAETRRRRVDPAPGGRPHDHARPARPAHAQPGHAREARADQHRRGARRRRDLGHAPRLRRAAVRQGRAGTRLLRHLRQRRHDGARLTTGGRRRRRRV
ncbi:MAG: hypothetical protein AVDCRST_MAG64-3594, partial [uncultured Phycisphaerae bacterium]